MDLFGSWRVSKGIFFILNRFMIFLKKRLGGMCGAILTSPFDVVKTRLQSDLFRHKHVAVGAMGNSSTVVMCAPRTTGLLYNFVETGGIIQYVSHKVLIF
jgi:solute carrier family 25 protein 33/36